MPCLITDRIIFAFGTVLYFSDLLFPLWLIGILIISRIIGWEVWKACFFASTFCLTQAYIVATIIGYNIGAYTLIWFGYRLFSLFYVIPLSKPISKYFTPFQSDLEFWVAPPIAIIILPTLILFVISKLIERSDQSGNRLEIRETAGEINSVDSEERRSD